MDENALHILLMLGFFRSNREILHRIVALDLMPGQPKILECLQRHDGCSQKEIGHFCILDKSTVTSLLKRMEGAGLIRKEPEPQDQRSLRVYLTETGRQKGKQVQELMEKIDGTMWEGISPQEKALFLKIFHQIINNQKKWEGDRP